MSQRLKQYLNDVFDGKNMNILEIRKDPNLQNRYQSIIESLNITDNQTLERCMKIIASESLKPPMKDGHIRIVFCGVVRERERERERARERERERESERERGERETDKNRESIER